MSTTLEIVCTKCRESLWIGQRNYIYRGEPDTMEMLEAFLFKHQSSEYDTGNHSLIFVNEHWDELYDGTWTRFSGSWNKDADVDG